MLQDHAGVLREKGTTQSAIISSSTSQAGVAAAAGEDNQYLDSVTRCGGDFIPLVCESFGVWTPYALSTLFMIADRSTVSNGLLRKLARRQSLQQPSVTLCHYNAKMILRQFALSSEDDLIFGQVM